MSRWVRGDGSVYQTKDGRWRGAVVIGHRDDGQPVRKVVGGKTRDEVAAKVRDLVTAREDDRVIGRDMMVGEWLAYWLRDVTEERVRPSTLERYRSLVRIWIIPAIGRVMLSRLRAEHPEQVIRAMRIAGQSPASQLQAFRVLSRALTIAVRRGHLTANPCGLLDAPSVQREEVRPLNVQEVRAVLAAAGDDAARWAVAFACGLRQGEVLGLAWDDVDTDAGTIHVRHSLGRVGGGLALGVPKSRAGRRVVHLPANVVALLVAHRKRQAKARLEAAPGSWVGYRPIIDGRQVERHLVFARPDGGPIDPRTDWRAFKALLAAAKVRDARIHDARHTAATLAITSGVDVRTVADQLGHSNPSLTLSTYSHALDETRRRLADRVDDTLWPKAAEA